MADSEIKVHNNSDDTRDNSFLDELRSLWKELRVLGHDYLQLAALETQLASKSLVVMIIAGLMIGILLSFSWIGLVIAIVLILAEYGVVENSITQTFIAISLNLLAAMILWGIICGKSRYLRFPATLRSLGTTEQSDHSYTTGEK